MLKSSVRSVIRLRGVRHNNLKNFDLDLPLNQLIVVTGLSGSGKSSLAFDTLFAEGQRRYIETFSPYARQFFDRMDKPQVDAIEGIPPAIAIEQRNAVRTTRSTVGTMTELCDYMKMLWPHIARLHCRQCHRPVGKESPTEIWMALTRSLPRKEAPAPGNPPRHPESSAPDVLITFNLPLTEKLPLSECLDLVAKQGYQRLMLGDRIVRLEEIASFAGPPPSGQTHLTVIQDRLTLASRNRARFVEACEQAYHFGKGKLEVRPTDNRSRSPAPPVRFSNRLHCATCDLEYREPSPALFSFNHPVGACPACRGFGRVISIDYSLALPDRTKSLVECVVKPWQTGLGAECQTDLLKMCRRWGVPIDVPFDDLPKKWQDFVIEGEPGYGKDAQHQWPRAWYGVRGYFRWLESKSYKMHVRVLLSRYRAYTPCPDCQGKRFQPETLLYRAPAPSFIASNPISVEDLAQDSTQAGGDCSLTLADFYQLPIRDALCFIESIRRQGKWRLGDPIELVLAEVRSRLGYLDQVGLGYLTLDRPTRTLSGGETERVNLTACLGTRLVNTLFVLDEPSVGLHARDTARLVRILQQLRDAGNTVVVVEHEASVMRAADQIVDLGPGHGATGGQVIFQGAYPEILKSPTSLTGRYLSGRKRIDVPLGRPVSPPPGKNLSADDPSSPCGATMALHESARPFGRGRAANRVLTLRNATLHNIKDLTVTLPLGRFVCVTGVSGSGKTTLIRELLWPALASSLKADRQPSKASDRLAEPQPDRDEDDDSSEPPSAQLEGADQLSGVVLVDQSILGKTPRSNPAVYIGAFDDIRELFADSEPARQRGLKSSAFSFNSPQGQCERCRGAGFEKIEMQFLSDVFIRCPDCLGRRYRPHILEVKLRAPSARPEPKAGAHNSGRVSVTALATLNPSPSKPTGGTCRAAGRPAVPNVAGPQAPVRAQSQARPLSIADLLDTTVEEAIEFLTAFVDSRRARRAAESLELLAEVGLGYLKLGQPINTLSGGESQRLKLVRHLADVRLGSPPAGKKAARSARGPDSTPPPVDETQPKPFLYLFDEPTTGLHYEDVRVLLGVFQRLVDAGHSVVVIEHNLEVIKSADWLIDLGPDAGDQGGQVVAQGTPQQVAACTASHTGRALAEILRNACVIAR
jgi:excinuclease ABC subunit A